MHGLVGRDPNTVANRTSLARTHIIPGLGKRRLAELTAEEIDCWLADKTKALSTVTLQRLLSILRHSIRRARRATWSSAMLRCYATYRRDSPAGRPTP
jgi:hypothetical protein